MSVSLQNDCVTPKPPPCRRSEKNMMCHNDVPRGHLGEEEDGVKSLSPG